MKCAIIYLSLTGNTKKIAQATARGMERANAQCDVIPLKAVEVAALPRYDLIGLGCPVWYWKEPPNIFTFMVSLPPMEGKHCFIFATHGADRGGIFPSMAATLKEKGLTVIGYHSWYADNWVPTYPKPYPTDGHPDEIDLEEAEKFGQEMVEQSQRISRGETDLIPRDFGKERARTQTEWIGMKINMARCRYPKCRLCMQRCPSGAIDLSASPIIFRQAGRCVSCFLCEIICPSGAIEADFEPEANRAREMIKAGVPKLLEKGVAKGYFRWQVPQEQIDYDTPMYKTKKYSRHPRFPLSRLP